MQRSATTGAPFEHHLDVRRLRVREEVDGRTMADKTTDSVVPAEVSGLIDESQRIQGWIARLADFEKESSPAVYEKVLTDYQSRLADVTGKLAAHRVELVKTLERHRTDVESWRGEREEHAADLEEAKLRHAVGELADSDWEKRRSSIETGSWRASTTGSRPGTRRSWSSSRSSRRSPPRGKRERRRSRAGWAASG